MTRFERQLLREAGWDVRVAAIGLAIFFGCMLVLPRDWFWFYFTPIALLWFRYLWVRNRRDEDLLRADEASRSGAIAYKGGVAITDGTNTLCFRAGADQDLVRDTHRLPTAGHLLLK